MVEIALSEFGFLCLGKNKMYFFTFVSGYILFNLLSGMDYLAGGT